MDKHKQATLGLLLSLAEGIKSAFVRCSTAVRAENSLFGFCNYLRLSVRYWADVPSENHKLPCHPMRGRWWLPSTPNKE